MTTTVTIPYLRNTAGDAIAATLVISLVDERNVQRVAFSTGDKRFAFEDRVVEVDGEDVAVELEPSETIALDNDGSPSFYQVRIKRHDGNVETYRFQVPDSVDPVDLLDLVGASSITPGSVFASRLVPDWSGATEGDVLAIVSGVPKWQTVGVAKVVWEDLPGAASTIPLQGQAGDPDRDTDGSLLFSSSSTEQMAILFQVPHEWYGTNMRLHIHWGKTTDAAGDVVWETRTRVWNVGDVPPSWSAWQARTGRSETIAADQRTLIDVMPELDMTGIQRSAMVSVQARRLQSDPSDDYAADARLWDCDLHHQRWGFMFAEEYPGA